MYRRSGKGIGQKQAFQEVVEIRIFLDTQLFLELKIMQVFKTNTMLSKKQYHMHNMSPSIYC